MVLPDIVNATGILFGGAAALLVVGLVRSARGARAATTLVPLQVFGLLVFGMFALASSGDDEPIAAAFVAAGLTAHAAWDAYHFLTHEVVSRPYAVFCLALDLTLALGVVIVTF